MLRVTVQFSLVHVDVSRAYFHAKAQGPMLLKLPAERLLGKGRWENRTAEEKACTIPEMQQAVGSEIGKGISEIGVASWGAVQETCSASRKMKFRDWHTETTLW